MSILEPDMTPRSGIDPVPEPKFSTVWRGYDPSQVSEYLRRLANRMRVLENGALELESELEEARKQSGTGPAAAAPTDPLEAVSDRVADVVRAFDRDVEQMRLEAEAVARRVVEEAQAEADVNRQAIEERRSAAEAEVEEMLAEARAEADRIRVDAQAKAEDIKARAERALEDARAKATEVLGELDDRRHSLLVDIRALHDRMLGSAKELEPILEREPAAEQGILVAEEDEAVDETADDAEETVSP